MTHPVANAKLRRVLTLACFALFFCCTHGSHVSMKVDDPVPLSSTSSSVVQGQVFAEPECAWSDPPCLLARNPLGLTIFLKGDESYRVESDPSSGLFSIPVDEGTYLTVVEPQPASIVCPAPEVIEVPPMSLVGVEINCALEQP
jgi:hypothetical protein